MSGADRQRGWFRSADDGNGRVTGERQQCLQDGGVVSHGQLYLWSLDKKKLPSGKVETLRADPSTALAAYP